MKTVTLWIVILAGVLAAQRADDELPVRKLTSNLMALQDVKAVTPSHRQTITDEIMSLSESAHRPSRSTVAGLADELIAALSGRKLSRPQISKLTTGILAVLHSAGTATFRFKGSVNRAEKALTSLGVSPKVAQVIGARLTAIGKEVRGPEDTPL